MTDACRQPCLGQQLKNKNRNHCMRHQNGKPQQMPHGPAAPAAADQRPAQNCPKHGRPQGGQQCDSEADPQGLQKVRTPEDREKVIRGQMPKAEGGDIPQALQQHIADACQQQCRQAQKRQ